MATASGIAAIVGVGQTDISSNSGRSSTRLLFEATQAALADAALDATTIDGIIPYPGGPSAEDIASVLQLPDVTFTASPHLGGASSVAALGLAKMAIETGEARCVLAFVARNGRSESPITRRVETLPGQHLKNALEIPLGLSTPAQWYALMCRRHMHEFGTSREALGRVALTMRANAQLYPEAQMYGRPMTYEQYIGSRVIADPYLLLDCCLESDGAAAVIVMAAETTAERPHACALILAAKQGHPDSPDDLSGRRDLFETGLTKAAPRAFAAAGLRPDDIDLAMIYDCFTFDVIQQIEEAGFCPRGEGGGFVLDKHIELDGSLPVNPHGGLLSAGHLAGMNHVVEAVRQLRGQCGERQVADVARIAVTGWGSLGDGALAILGTGQ
jgi:acetyl-CoA acetyltransferase